MYKETKTRTIVKTISWRFWATVTTTALVFLFIGEPEVALSIGIIEVFLKLLIYFFHERAWAKIKFGRSEIQPFVVWLTGLSRAGKTRIAEILSQKMKKFGLKVQHLDGHNIRTIFTETGFSKSEVNEHIKRVGYLASILEKQGIFVIASFLSPYEEARNFVRKLSNNFVEVYVSTPLEICKERDKTGLYERAIKGEIQNLPGINSPYQPPENPEIIIDTSEDSYEDAAQKIFTYLHKFIK
ncbi:MAG: adenylyl-sulfate kinase [Ignavibacteria bacterium]|jgi:adenylylsulfate kinase